MRLIDADSIKFKPYYDEYVDYDGYINDLKTWQLDDVLSDRVDNTPTVMAIPIDYMKQWAKDRTRENWFADHPSVIARLIVDWENENE